MSMLLSFIPILLVLTGFFVFSRCLRSYTAFNQLEVILSAFVLNSASIVSLSLVWGVIGLYRAWPIFASYALLLVILFVRTRAKGKKSFLRGVAAAVQTSWGSILWPTKLLLIAAAAVSAWVLLLAAVLNDTSFDAMNYHLSWAASAVQEGHLGLFSTPVPWINVYAKNIDLWYSWFLLNHGSDWLVDFMQWPFALLGTLALYLLARQLRFGRDAAVLASVPFLFLPVVIQQGTTNYIDLAIGSLSFVLAAFALSPRSGYATALVMGSASGLLVGSKPTTILVVAASWIVFILARYYRGNDTPRDLVRYAALLFFPTFFLSAYWYIRNMIEYGSFVYPLRISIGSFTLIDGLVNTQDILSLDQPEILQGVNLMTNVFLNTYASAAVKYDMTPGSFGPVWAWLALPCLVIATLLWVGRRQYARLAMSWLFILLFALMPGHWWWRYVMILFGAGALALAESYESLVYSKKAKIAFALSVTLLCGWSFLTARWPTSVTADIFLTRLQGTRTFSHRYGPVFDAIAAEQRAGTTIAYDSHWFVVYPLWNEQRTNRVIHVPFSADWITQLRRQEVGLLAIHAGSPELEYLQSRTSEVTLLAEDDLYHLYRLAD